MLDTVQGLLKENEAILLRERRSAQRRPFVRPVEIALASDTVIECFSRDISPVGIAIITPQRIPLQTIASITVHSLRKKAVTLNAELRWCEPYGEGWLLTGWHFLDRPF